MWMGAPRCFYTAVCFRGRPRDRRSAGSVLGRTSRTRRRSRLKGYVTDRCAVRVPAVRDTRDLTDADSVARRNAGIP